MNAIVPTTATTGAHTAEAGLERIEKLVTFSLIEEEYGVAIREVREIILMTDITPVPRAPAFVEGVINLRGQIIPIVDLRKRFNLGASAIGADSRIVVVEVDHHVLGLIVDKVSDVRDIPTSKINPPPALVASGIGAEYIRGIANRDGQLTVLIDLKKVFTASEMSALKTVG